MRGEHRDPTPATSPGAREGPGPDLKKRSVALSLPRCNSVARPRPPRTRLPARETERGGVNNPVPHHRSLRAVLWQGEPERCLRASSARLEQGLPPTHKTPEPRPRLFLSRVSAREYGCEARFWPAVVTYQLGGGGTHGGGCVWRDAASLAKGAKSLDFGSPLGYFWVSK